MIDDSGELSAPQRLSTAMGTNTTTSNKKNTADSSTHMHAANEVTRTLAVMYFLVIYS